MTFVSKGDMDLNSVFSIYSFIIDKKNKINFHISHPFHNVLCIFTKKNIVKLQNYKFQTIIMNHCWLFLPKRHLVYHLKWQKKESCRKIKIDPPLSYASNCYIIGKKVPLNCVWTTEKRNVAIWYSLSLFTVFCFSWHT